MKVAVHVFDFERESTYIDEACNVKRNSCRQNK